MPAQNIRFRKQRPNAFLKGNPVEEKLKLGFVYRELYFRLHGTVNVTAAGTANSAPMNPESIIKRLAVIMDGNNTLRVTDGPALRELTRTYYGTYGHHSVVDPTSVAQQSFDSYLVLPIWMPHSLRPIDTALDSSPLSNFTYEISWGDISDIVGDATAAWVTEPQIECRSLESFGVSPPGDQWRSYSISQPIAAANTQMQIPLTIGNMVRAFQIRTLANNGAGVAAPARSVLNNLKLISGSETYFDLDEYDLANLGTIRKNVDSIDTGYYYVDMVTDGYMTEALDSLGFSELYLEADVNAPAGARIDVWPQEFVPVRGKQGSGG